jgi:hypothetical protein
MNHDEEDSAAGDLSDDEIAALAFARPRPVQACPQSHPQTTSHTIHDGTVQAGGRKQCCGNFTSRQPANHWREASRKAESKA